MQPGTYFKTNLGAYVCAVGRTHNKPESGADVANKRPDHRADDGRADVGTEYGTYLNPDQVSDVLIGILWRWLHRGH